nr:alpha-2-macroglobulin-like [Microcebus murinus]
MEKNKLLHSSLVLLLLVLLPTEASGSAKPHYMVLVPSLLHTETPEKGCVLLSYLNETVTVRASLESLRGNRSLFTDLVAEKDLFHCVSFTIPRSSSSQEVMFLTVQVKGSTQQFSSRTTVMVKNKESLVFVQTDKPIYKPKQTVKFRVVSLDEDFHPVNELIPLVYIQDPKRNRIAQWQSLQLESGLTQLSFALSSEPFLGSYKVVVQKQSGGNVEHPFTVEEFVLPKFEVQVTMPKVITILEEEMNVSVCGLENLNSHGCVSQQVNTKVFQMKREGYQMKLDMEANIKEEGTGVELTGRGSTEITRAITKLSFVKVNPYFRRGIPFFGQVRLVDGKGVPMPNKTIFITAHGSVYKSNATTDENGLAPFSINTTSVMGISLTVHVIMAKGGIVRTGTHVLPVEQGDMKGHFSVSVPVGSDIAPVARLLIYAILPDGEVIGDSAMYNVENCLTNKKFGFLSFVFVQVYNLLPVRDLTGFPAGLSQQEEDDRDCVYGYNMNISGRPYIMITDIHEKDMYSFLQDMGLRAFTNSKIRKPTICLPLILYSPRIPKPVEEIGKKMNTNLFPNILNQIIDTDVMEQGHETASMMLAGGARTETVRKYFPETWIWDLVVADSSGVAEVGVSVPDTITEWKAGALCLSQDTGLGLSLTASLRVFQPFFVELTMPYSVIRGEAFTLRASVVNYHPKCLLIFVHLEATPAFQAVPVEKEQETVCVCGDERQTVSWEVTPKSLGNVNFTVSAQALSSSESCGNEKDSLPEYGKKDTIIKLLLVEPEGIKKEVTFNSLLCPSGAEVTEELSLKLPPNTVEGSARASVSVVGDILGSAIQNIQNLLQMPYGCGEQNMVLFAPNIYVLDYLNETQQLTPDIESKAIGYLNTGYQRQLNYKHHDGSYSTFGEQGGRSQGNTWLTAFVLKTFAQARNHIFIYEAHITQALTWLSQEQKDNGCFRSSGSLFNDAIKGGVEDEATLSAYVTIAFLEIPLPVTHPVVRNAVSCLESAWKSAKEGARGSHVYTKALLAYAFALAGNQDKRAEVLKSLHEESVKKDESVHWERPEKPKPQERYFEPQAPSAEVEMTSYVLLAHLTAQPAPTSEDLASATRIVKWITKQQNSQGGFSSTQDTVVALHALSKYGAATFTRTGKAVQVTVQSSGAFSTKFQVDNNNRLVLQQVSLPELPGEYSTRVTGDSCVYLQTSLKFNVVPEKEEFPFALEVQTLPQTCDGPKAHTSFQISLNVSYTGSRPASNMAIADVKMLSGFIPLKPTVKMLERSNHVSRTEVSNDHVLIYLDKVPKNTLSFSFTVLQDIPVRDLKPAIVKVYDYYETDEFAIAEYNAPCSKDQGNV